MSKKKVLVVSTGGTIEKSYCEENGSLENRQSQLKLRLLSKLRLPHTEIEVIELMAKDSLFMNDDDRLKIGQFIKEQFSVNRPIVVIHGTDTMEVTARYCFEQFPNPSIPVIFTGAMRPAGFEDSDATQNFVEALMASQIVSPGYYVSFHGHLFNVPNVRKNKTTGSFEEVK